MGKNKFNNKEKLENILLSDNLDVVINNNRQNIFAIIPELKGEVGFLQKNPYHSYDVWNHTLVALKNSKNDIIIRLSLLLHDIGKIYSYQDDGDIRHFKGHAAKSSELAAPILKRIGYSDDIIKEICYLIENHATTIHIGEMSEDNISLFQKLLHVQFCDASAYAPEYAEKIFNDLKKIQVLLLKKSKNLYKR